MGESVSQHASPDFSFFIKEGAQECDVPAPETLLLFSLCNTLSLTTMLLRVVGGRNLTVKGAEDLPVSKQRELILAGTPEERLRESTTSLYLNNGVILALIISTIRTIDPN